MSYRGNPVALFTLAGLPFLQSACGQPAAFEPAKAPLQESSPSSDPTPSRHAAADTGQDPWGALCAPPTTHAVAPQPGSAPPTPLAEVTILSSVAQQFARKALPLPLRISGKEQPVATIVDVVYCGATEPSRARAIALVWPGDGARALSGVPILAAPDCSVGVTELATRVAALPSAPAWVAVAPLSLQWSNWELRVTANDIAFARKAGRLPVVPAEADSIIVEATRALKNNCAPIVAFGTKGLRVPLAEGPELLFDLAVAFGPHQVNAFFAPAVDSPNWGLPALREDPQLVEQPEQPNTKVTLPYASINAEVSSRTFTARSGGNVYELENLVVSGQEDSLELAGKVRHRGTGIDVNANAKWVGQDLTLAQVHAAAPHASCHGNLLEQAACLGRGALVENATGSISKALTEAYAGKPLRVLAEPPLVPIRAVDKDFMIRIHVTKTKASASELIAYGTLGLE
jgi:hypothetical protein